MTVDLRSVCKMLAQNDNVVIFTHKKPDGDTLGSAFGLMWMLQDMGKRARVVSADGVPGKYDILCKGYDHGANPDWKPSFAVAVDAASLELLGSGPEEAYPSGMLDLCIDHHKSNTMYAKNTYLDVSAPAVCQIIHDLAPELGVKITKRIADALYLGLATDTGCFRYASTTAKSHAAAAALIEAGADHALINKLMFDTRSRGLLMVERLLGESVTFYYGDRCAIAVLPADVTTKYGVSDEDLDGVASFTARIEGVLAGVTVRAKPDDTFRVSVRSMSPVDSSVICQRFGGGGHINAAGCTMSGDLYAVVGDILAAVESEFTRNGIL